MQIIGTVQSTHKLFLPESSLPQQFDGVLIYKFFEDYLGVAEFTAPADSVVIPQALFEKYMLKIGDQVTVEQVQLPKGTQITLQAQDSLDWKHVLEQYLPQHYTSLQEGQEIVVEYNGVHKITVKSCLPEPAICIINTDLDLQLDAPESQAQQLGLGTYELIDSLVEFTRGGFLDVKGIAKVGPLNNTSASSFYARVVNSSIKLDEPFAVYGNGTISLSETSPQRADMRASSSSSETTVCSICGKSVPTQSMIPHQAFCARNTKKCGECGATFSNEIPANHWHCAQCGHAETSDFEADHRQLHTPAQCQCGFQGTFEAVALHKTRECPQKLIVCRFCHLLQPQGEETPVNRLQGLSEHEASCGTKTVDCPQCNKIVLVRNLESHMSVHDQMRRDRALLSPSICANVNCPNLTASPGKQPNASHLDLCDTCYGIIYVPGNDPDMSKLRSRLERRYVIQLTSGCGQSWCSNGACFSGSGHKLSFKDAAAKAASLREDPKIWLCVDQIASRKAMFLTEEPKFAREWKGMAISTCGTESAARTWLANNAPRIDGS